jgi:hypothetical protein
MRACVFEISGLESAFHGKRSKAVKDLGLCGRQRFYVNAD